MSAPRDELLSALARSGAELAQAAERFTAAKGDQVELYRAEISAGIGDALTSLRETAEATTGGNLLCRELVEDACGYVEWLQWVLWDLPVFAVALAPEPARFRRRVAACGLVYLSFRLLDDLLDRHYLYRGRQATLLASLAERHGAGGRAEGLAMLGAMMLCLEGLGRLTAEIDRQEEQPFETLSRVLASARRTLTGMVMELDNQRSWSRADYDRLVQLKNVDYWRILYAAVDPQFASPLYDYLCEYTTLAQHLNDLQDTARDEQLGQPNLVSVLRSCATGAGEGASAAGSPEHREAGLQRQLEEEIGQSLLALHRHAEGLPETERDVAMVKLHEFSEEARRLGLFTADRDHDPTAPADSSAVPGLHWDDSLEQFVAALGPDVLEDVACPVCLGSERTQLFRKQGFALCRCASCTHVYVSPRLRQDRQQRLIASHSSAGEDPFLEVQRIYAGFLCGLIAQQARGPRLLDLGFGQGYLLRMARAHGFEVYGVETSPARVEALRPMFGRRLHLAQPGDSSLPWDSFDVVVMSHVVEHLPDPRPLLRAVRDALIPGGLLYLAVPDMDSVQFRIFGKRWDVISPLVHYQYFNEVSLRHLLEQLDYQALERVEQPPYQSARAQGWMKLFRRLGGSESGELAMLCRTPELGEDPPETTDDGDVP